MDWESHFYPVIYIPHRTDHSQGHMAVCVLNLLAGCRQRIRPKVNPFVYPLSNIYYTNYARL